MRRPLAILPIVFASVIALAPAADAQRLPVRKPGDRPPPSDPPALPRPKVCYNARVRSAVRGMFWGFAVTAPVGLALALNDHPEVRGATFLVVGGGVVGGAVGWFTTNRRDYCQEVGPTPVAAPGAPGVTQDSVGRMPLPGVTPLPTIPRPDPTNAAAALAPFLPLRPATGIPPARPSKGS